MSAFKHEFRATSYLDTTSSDVFVDRHKEWFELELDGEVIGEAMLECYDGDWFFAFRSNTHELKAKES